ncbi:MAG: alpha-galactosidase [Carnobacterium inhibens]
MIEVRNGNFFHLKNNKISYVFHVMENNHLGHLYYGKTLGELSDSDIQYLTERNNKSAGTVKFSTDDDLFTLTDRFQEYPVYGSSDFKEGAIEVSHNNDPWYLDFKFIDYRIEKKKERNLAVPSTYALEGESETLIIQLEDEEHKLNLEMQFTLFEDFGAVVRSQKLINIGPESVMIEKMLSGVLELPTANYDFLHLSGAWLKERHPKKRKLAQGTVSVGSLKGASGHQHNPFVALVEENAKINKGEVYAANIIYSGNFLAQAEVDEWDKTRLMIGINPSQFSWQLQPSKSFVTPEAILMYSDEGLNGISSQFAGFTEKHIINREWKKTPRPIVFNNWEATYFDFDQDKLLELAKLGKELGMECFVVDDGWFGKRNNDRSSLGDWYYDKNKFTKGIGTFADSIHQMGLQLGIWFEPEMVSPESQLYKDHPEWVVRHSYSRVSIGRGQYVLDFSNPKVVDEIYGQMKEVILETNLEYIKWDMNRNITEAYSTYLQANGVPQTEFFHRYILGVYALYEKILSDFPDILIEGCAGGGGRYDLGILFYSPQIWPSDDSDAIERLTIQTGTLLGYPLSTFSNHVSASPNHQVERVTSLQTRQNVSIFGPLGYELDLTKLSDEEKEEIKTCISFYKKHRNLLVHGEFFQLLDPFGDTNEVSWGVANEDKSEFIIGFYRKMAVANPPALDYIKVSFLTDDKIYSVNKSEEVSGKVLSHFGLRKPYQFNGANHHQAQVKGDFQSYIYHLVESDKNGGK